MSWILEFVLSAEEIQSAIKDVQGRLLARARRHPLDLATRLALFAACAAAAYFFLDHSQRTRDAGWAGFVVSCAAILILLAAWSHGLARRAREQAIAANPELHVSPRTLIIDERGVRHRSALSSSETGWRAFLAVDRTADATLLMLDAANFILVPDRAFASPAERDACAAFMRERVARRVAAGAQPEPMASGSAPVLGQGDPVPPRQASQSGWRRLAQTLIAGVRLAALRPVDASSIHVSPAIVLGLLAILVLQRFAVDFAHVGPEGTFAPFGIPALLFPAIALLVVALALGRFAHPPGRLMTLLVGVIAMAVPLALIEQGAALAAEYARLPRGLAAWWPHLPPAWSALAALLAGVRLLDLQRGARLAAALGSLVFVAGPLHLVYRDATLWQPAYDPNSNAEAFGPLPEEAVFLQPRLLERALATLQPQVPGATDLYFVGVGGYASQDVFRKEVSAVSALMGERFATTGRSVSLVNNRQSMLDTPMASLTTLRATLRRIGEIIDRDEDMVFVFLTSHGSADHRFSLEFWPIRFNDLTPAALRDALDEAGIRWRVVVVSACYSGGFIDPLKNDNTIVITASAPDRNSFGCSNENDWTYFGKAFFDEALRGDRDLASAFDKAKALVDRREEQEQTETKSDPRIAVGPAMQQKWTNYLAATTGARPVQAPTAATAPTDVYGKYIGMWRIAETLPAYRRECEGELNLYSPLQTYRADNNAYGGIRPGTPQWTNVVGAWERYVERFCGAIGDADYLSLYQRVMRETVEEQRVEAALNLLGTSEGNRVVQWQNQVSLEVGRRLAQLRREATVSAMKALEQENARTLQEFRNQSAGRTP